MRSTKALVNSTDESRLRKMRSASGATVSDARSSCTHDTPFGGATLFHGPSLACELIQNLNVQGCAKSRRNNQIARLEFKRISKKSHGGLEKAVHFASAACAGASTTRLHPASNLRRHAIADDRFNVELTGPSKRG